MAKNTNRTSVDKAIAEIIATAVADAIRPLQIQIDDIRRQVAGERPGRLLTRRDVMTELAVSSTTMSAYIGAGVIIPHDQTVINGERHRFTRTELKRVKALPSGQVRTMLAMWRAKQARKKREANNTKKAA